MEAAVNVDEEIKNQISRLSATRKKSLLELIKFFAEEDESHVLPQTIEEYNREIEEADKRIDAGEFYTHDEMKELMNHLFK